MKKKAKKTKRAQVPSYLKHARGQGFVRIRRRNVYLGRYGSQESLAKYRKVVGEYLATGEAPQVTKNEGGSEYPTLEEVMAQFVVKKLGKYTDNERGRSRPAPRATPT